MGQLSGLPSPAKSYRNSPSTAASSPLGPTTDHIYRERKRIIRARRELEKCYRSSLSMGGSGELLYMPAAILPLRSYHSPNSLHTSPASVPPLNFVANGATAANSGVNIVPALPPKPNSGGTAIANMFSHFCTICVAMAMDRAGHRTRSLLNSETQFCYFGQKRGPVQIQQQQQQQMPWMVPAFAVIHVLAFILIMSHNNCDMRAITGSDACVFGILKRFSFQPLKENPSLGPSAASLLEFGALESELVTKAGEGWRLVTTISLHAGVFHLAVNLAGLCYIGLQLEKEFGAFKVGLIYFIPGVAGALVSALFVHGRVSVGASGALMGLIAARLSEILINWDSSSNHHGHHSVHLVIISIILLLVTNLVFGLMPHVDNFTHVGGGATGLLLGSVLLTRPKFEWVNQQCFPTVIYDVDDLPTRPKHSQCQNIVWILSLNILIAGYMVAFFALFTGMDIRKRCSWCQYMTCLPTHLWACSGDRDVTCRSFTEGKDFLRENCFDQRMREWSTLTSWNQMNRDFIKQCIRTCV